MRRGAALFLVAALLLPFLATAQAQEIPRGETVYVSSDWGPPKGFNPLLPSVDWMTEAMYPSLFMYSRFSDEWIPYAAESYKWVDRYTLEVKIRPEAKWWDGRPVTAEDVKYTFELGKKYTIGDLTPMWDYIEQVKVIDQKTVQLITSEAKLNYFQLLGILTTYILPQHRWSALERDLGGKIATEYMEQDPAKIVGAGPYRLLRFTEDTFCYVRVDDWWGRDLFGLPRPTYICHRTFRDNPAAALAFEAGELDTMTHFTPKIWELWEVKRLERRTYYAKQPYYLGDSPILLYMNYEKKALADPNVRKAIAHAIPFDELISKPYYNYSIRASPSLIVHTSPAGKYIDKKLEGMYPVYDLSKARKILDDANIRDRDGDGWRELPDGTPLKGLTIQVPYGWTDWMAMCEIIASNLKQIGIEVSTEFPDFSVWWQRSIDKQLDLNIGWSAGVGYAHPWNVFRFVMDPRLSMPAGNWANYKNQEVIAIIDAIPKETDSAKLQQYYSRLQELFLRDLPGVPLFYGAVWYEYSAQYWVGWPAEENQRWFDTMWSWPSNLPVWFYVAKKGQDPAYPAWINRLKFSTTKFFDDLEKVIAPPPPPPQVTGATTVTVTQVRTVEQTRTVMATQTVAVTQVQTRTEVVTDVTTAAIAAVVALIIGAVAGFFVGRRRRAS
ncbi:MAG: ABC transporter substrate-binding protein [Nitrososphaerota archaeon]